MKPSVLLKSAETANPFLKINKNVIPCLEKEIPNSRGKKLLHILEEVAGYLNKNNLPYGTISVSGSDNSSLKRRLFLNLNVLKKEMPEEFEKVTPMHYCVHTNSTEFPNVIVLKANTFSEAV